MCVELGWVLLIVVVAAVVGAALLQPLGRRFFQK